jgi:hypothetical protein
MFGKFLSSRTTGGLLTGIHPHEVGKLMQGNEMIRETRLHELVWGG